MEGFILRMVPWDSMDATSVDPYLKVLDHPHFSCFEFKGSMSRYVKICQDMSRYVKICQDMSRYVKICQDMSRYVKIYLACSRKIGRFNNSDPL